MNRMLKPDARAARREVQRSGEPPSYQLPVAEARRRLLEADVTVLFHCMVGQIHEFLGDTHSPDSSVALERIAGGPEVLTEPSRSTPS